MLVHHPHVTLLESSLNQKDKDSDLFSPGPSVDGQKVDMSRAQRTTTSPTQSLQEKSIESIKENLEFVTDSPTQTKHRKVIDEFDASFIQRGKHGEGGIMSHQAVQQLF